METLLQPTQVPSLDCVERFLYLDHHSSHSPISTGSSSPQSPTDICDLESKVLVDLLWDEEVPPRTPPVTVPDMENRMSPDSSVEWHMQQQHQQPQHFAQLSSPSSSMVSSPMSSASSSSTAAPQPDSTTNDHVITFDDSDAFNSEDSCDSSSENGQFLGQPENFREQFPGGPEVQQQQQAMIPLQQVKTKKKKKSKRAGDVLLRCEEERCDYTTRFKEHLTSHMHTHRSDRNYMCHDCGQTFKWSHSLKRHQRTHKPADQYKYSCRHCFKAFSRKDHLTIHENLHTDSSESYPCADCGATFKNKKTLAGHAKTHSAQRKGFHCGQCDSEFTRRASLNRHVRAAHAGQTIACDFCPATFSYRSTMEDHKKAVHNDGRREFGCDLCGVQFAVKAYLTKHMVTCRNRADGKSFSCRQCSKTFPTRRHLNEHSKRKHEALEEKPEVQQVQQEPQQPSDQRLPSILPMQIKEELVTHGHHLATPGHPHQHHHQHLGYGSEEFHGHFYPHALPNLPSPVTGSDLTLPQLEEPPAVAAEEENVGSLMRLVYSCGAESSSPSPSSSSSTSEVSYSGRLQPVNGGHHNQQHYQPHQQAPVYHQHHHHHQADKMSGQHHHNHHHSQGEQYLVDYPIVEGLPPIDCL